MINLLPWRLEFNKRKCRNFLFSVIITILFAATIILIWHLYLADKINNQYLNNQQLNNELKSSQQQYSQNIADQKQHELLLSRLQTITDLQHKQQSIAILQEVANNTPVNIYLLTIKKAENLITIEGIAQTHQDIINFITKLKRSKLLTQIKLQEIAAKKNINFILEAT